MPKSRLWACLNHARDLRSEHLLERSGRIPHPFKTKRPVGAIAHLLARAPQCLIPACNRHRAPGDEQQNADAHCDWTSVRITEAADRCRRQDRDAGCLRGDQLRSGRPHRFKQFEALMWCEQIKLVTLKPARRLLASGIAPARPPVAGFGNELLCVQRRVIGVRFHVFLLPLSKDSDLTGAGCEVACEAAPRAARNSQAPPARTAARRSPDAHALAAHCRWESESRQNLPFANDGLALQEVSGTMWPWPLEELSDPISISASRL